MKVLLLVLIMSFVSCESHWKRCHYEVFQQGQKIDEICNKNFNCFSESYEGIYYKWTGRYCDDN